MPIEFIRFPTYTDCSKNMYSNAPQGLKSQSYNEHTSRSHAAAADTFLRLKIYHNAG
jgi:hypothetical protein